MRRIAAITILSLAMMIPIRLLYLLTAFIPAWYTSSVGPLAGTVLMALYLAVLVTVLRRWHAQAESAWFLHWRPRSLAFAICVLGLLLVVVPVVGTSAVPQIPVWVSRVTIAAATVMALLQILVWLRWTDQKPRRARAVFQGACGWFLFMLFITVVQLAITPKILVETSGNIQMVFDLVNGGASAFAGVMAAAGGIGAIGLGILVQAAAALVVYAMVTGAVWAWGRWRRGVEMT